MDSIHLKLIFSDDVNLKIKDEEVQTNYFQNIILDMHFFKLLCNTEYFFRKLKLFVTANNFQIFKIIAEF